jgi:hypothetical protein
MRTAHSASAAPASASGARLAIALAIACAALAAADAHAAEPPVLKSGLWELSRGAGAQSDTKRVTTMCLDESVQAQMREFGLGMAKELCSKSDRRFEGNRLIIDAVCKLGETTMTTHSVMTFSGNTAYHTDGTATYDPPMMNTAETSSSIDGKWVGDCKPAQQPGDITLESGQTINIKNMIRK